MVVTKISSVDDVEVFIVKYFMQHACFSNTYYSNVIMLQYKLYKKTLYYFLDRNTCIMGKIDLISYYSHYR